MEQFTRPDSGPDRTPFCCSFHWFGLPDGRVMGLDLIRAGDEWSIRLFLVDQAGRLTGITSRIPQVALAGASLSLPAVGNFGMDLRITVTGPIRDTAWALRARLVNLAARDYLSVRYEGTVRIGEADVRVDSPGTASVHYGRFLPQYAYAVAMPGAEYPLLLTAAAKDNFLWLAVDRWTYGYHGIGHQWVYGIKMWEPSKIPLVGHEIQYSVISRFEHELLGLPTITAVADAQLCCAGGEIQQLCRVILDCRGPAFLGAI